MPDNLHMDCKPAFLRLPAVCLPQERGRGSSNYTLKDLAGHRIEVQLKSKAFHVKTLAAGFPMPHVAWLKHNTMEEAWQEAVYRCGGWAV
eukprot:12347716-Alexandrium_andersonii.AAC.1